MLLYLSKLFNNQAIFQMKNLFRAYRKLFQQQAYIMWCMIYSCKSGYLWEFIEHASFLYMIAVSMCFTFSFKYRTLQMFLRFNRKHDTGSLDSFLMLSLWHQEIATPSLFSSPSQSEKYDMMRDLNFSNLSVNKNICIF